MSPEQHDPAPRITWQEPVQIGAVLREQVDFENQSITAEVRPVNPEDSFDLQALANDDEHLAERLDATVKARSRLEKNLDSEAAKQAVFAMRTEVEKYAAEHGYTWDKFNQRNDPEE